MAITEPPATTSAAASGGAVPPDDPIAKKAVEAIQKVFGKHGGYRVAHAPGIVCSGRFVPTKAGSEIGRAHHLQNTVPVKVRFSNSPGDPGIPDGHPDVHGMATRFYLGKKGCTDIVAVTLPCFFVRDAASFIELSATSRRVGDGKPPLPRPLKLLRFYLDHPESRRAIRASLAPPAVPSYANCRYNALHAFKWEAPGRGKADNFVRYSWVPEDRERTISRWRARSRPRDYLRQDIYDRLGRTPVRPIRFTLQLHVASLREIDQGLVCDPTAVWPDDLRRVDAGRLELTGLERDEPVQEKVLVFDPTSVTEGIELPSVDGDQGRTCDEILELRHNAYGISARMRTGNP